MTWQLYVVGRKYTMLVGGWLDGWLGRDSEHCVGKFG